MHDDDLSEYLRTRVSKPMKNDFDEICRELGKTPTEQLRELVGAFVKREYGRLNDRINVHIFKPAGYEPEAWRVTIKLRDPAEMTWDGAPIPFGFPSLPQRRIHSDPEYLAVFFAPGTHTPTPGGKFVRGEWRGKLYSNGCLETENPTPLEEVRATLTSTIEQIIGQFSPPQST
ncbi:MAG TPA: hypothetical protein PK677_15030 [Acidiphilium sp.]|nr:hypothetical protein [Acidiphilium sp.]